MTLSEMLLESPAELADKHLQQIIAFAGSGKLRDGNDCSSEFCLYLQRVPSDLLRRYADQCLTSRFEDSGAALQDVVNEIGRRLGFLVTNGRYRGTSSQVGNDGLWQSASRHSIVVETKTTDAYRIDLDVISGYRRSLVDTSQIDAERSSVLIVVGREDTGDLEAQIRGSRHAWDVRLISIDALARLMSFKEEIDDPQTLTKVQEVLIPREFTKLDEIIDLVFSATEDVLQGGPTDVDADSESGSKFTPVNFNEACISRIEARLEQSLVKRTRATFSSADNAVVVVCTVSREHGNSLNPSYWFAFKPHHRDALVNAREGYAAFGCGSAATTLLVPISEFALWLDGLNVTRKDDRMYWHVSIFRDGDRLVLRRMSGYERIDLTQYLVAGT
jgi:hypothetical protein